MNVNFDDLTYAEAKTVFELLQSENEKLQARVVDLERRAGVWTPPEVELKRFASLRELEAAGENAWERIPEEEAAMLDPTGFGMRLKANMFNKRMRENGWHLPFRNVIVEGLGEVRRMGGTGWDADNYRGGLANEDWECIAALRVLNLTNPIWMSLIQPGDDKWEGDELDRRNLVAEYAMRVKAGQASTRVATKTWAVFPQARAYLEIFRDVYGGDYDPRNPRRPIPVTDV